MNGISKKVIAQTLGHVLSLVIGFVVARQGIHMDAATSAEVAGLASVIVGPLSGYMAKEAPVVAPIAADVQAAADPLLAVLAESGANPRSALHGAVSSAAPVPAPVAPVAPAPAPEAPAAPVA